MIAAFATKQYSALKGMKIKKRLWCRNRQGRFLVRKEKMANEENLIRFTERTPKERREIAKKAGIASGKSRRAKKQMKELAEIMLNSKASGNAAKTAKRFGADLDDEDVTNAAAIIAGQIASALKGNTQAAKFVTDLIEGTIQHTEEEDELSKSLRELAEKL